MNRDFLLGSNFVIPAQAGIQQKNTPRSGQIIEVDRLRRHVLKNWISAFAGMTALLEILR